MDLFSAGLSALNAGKRWLKECGKNRKNSFGGGLILNKNNMEQELKEQLIKRLKSFAWRAGAFIVVSGLAAIVDILGILKVEPVIITVVGLITGEITKYVNTYYLKKE